MQSRLYWAATGICFKTVAWLNTAERRDVELWLDQNGFMTTAELAMIDDNEHSEQ